MLFQDFPERGEVDVDELFELQKPLPYGVHLLLIAQKGTMR